MEQCGQLPDQGLAALRLLLRELDQRFDRLLIPNLRVDDGGVSRRHLAPGDAGREGDHPVTRNIAGKASLHRVGRGKRLRFEPQPHDAVLLFSLWLNPLELSSHVFQGSPRRKLDDQPRAP